MNTTKTVLGRSGLKVGRIGLGSSYGAEAAAYEFAFEHGINYFYWGTYRRCGMGQAIRNLAPKHRSDMVITLQSYSRWAPLMEFTFKRGLRALKIDYADILLLGWYNKYPPAKLLERARQLKEKGLVRAIAISGHNRPLFVEFAKDPTFDVIMVRYNAAHRGAERDVFQHLDSNPSLRPGVITYTTTRYKTLMDSTLIPANERCPTAADCYQFSLSHPKVDMALCGPASLKEMQENIDALKRGPMTEDELAWMKRVGDAVYRGKRGAEVFNPFMPGDK